VPQIPPTDIANNTGTKIQKIGRVLLTAVD